VITVKFLTHEGTVMLH